MGSIPELIEPAAPRQFPWIRSQRNEPESLSHPLVRDAGVEVLARLVQQLSAGME